LKESVLMQIKANGITINYQVDGPDGAPWLVLSNSLATNLAMWEEQARELGRAFRVLRYDQRGHGATEAPAGRYAFDLLIADALALMDALAIRKAHFAGLSMGGATALGLAQQHPDRLDRVVVCDSPCQSTPTSSQQWEERIVIAQKQGMEALVEPTMTRWFPPEVMKANPPHLDKVRQMIRTTPVNGFIGCAAALADHNYAAAVATVKRPVLFLVGESSPPPRCPCASSTRRCPARVMSSLPAPGTFPTSTSPRLSPAPLPIFWRPNEGAAAPACRRLDCKLAGRSYTFEPRSSRTRRGRASHFKALGFIARAPGHRAEILKEKTS
jgi:3-oxoadipate enol-lactonase